MVARRALRRGGLKLEVIPVVGMKTGRIDQMNAAQTSTVEAHVRTLIRLLLGDKPMKPGLSFVAGQQLALAGRVEIAEMATASQIDVVYLAFRIDDAGVPVLADIAVFLPRDRVCCSWTGCVPTLAPGKERAALVSPNYQGYFSILPGEIVQRQTRAA